TAHAAVLRLPPRRGARSPRARGFRISSAHRRSALVSGPPVWSSDSDRSASQPAASSSATATACFTKPDTLVAEPRAIRRRMAASCASSNVIVNLVVAIPHAIPHCTPSGQDLSSDSDSGYAHDHGQKRARLVSGAADRLIRCLAGPAMFGTE